MAPSPSDLKGLLQLASQTAALFAHYQTTLRSALSSSPAPPSVVPANAISSDDDALDKKDDLPPPLPVVHTSSTLLRAHATKLGLLLANDPITPSAVMRELRGASECIGALISAVELCKAEKYGTLLKDEVTRGVLRCLVEVGRVVACVETAAKTGKADKQEPITATGLVWEACDSLIELARLGIAGIAAKKAEQWRGLLVDAIAELREWAEEDEEDDDDDNDGFLIEDGNNGAIDKSQNGLLGEEDFSASNTLSKQDTALREQLEGTLKSLKHIDLLYKAVIKRRLQTFPKLDTTPANKDQPNGNEVILDTDLSRLNQLTSLVKSIPDTVDDLAAAFYDLDASLAQELLDKVCADAKSVASTAEKGWKGMEEKDRFTEWVGNWVDMVEKTKR